MSKIETEQSIIQHPVEIWYPDEISETGPYEIKYIGKGEGKWPYVYFQYKEPVLEHELRQILRRYEDFLRYPLVRVEMKAREIQRAHESGFTGVFFVTQYMAGAIETEHGIQLLGDINDQEKLGPMWKTMSEKGQGMILIGIAAGHTQHINMFESVGLRIKLPFDKQIHPIPQGNGDWIFSVRKYLNPEGDVEVGWFNFQTTEPVIFRPNSQSEQNVIAADLFVRDTDLWKIVHAEHVRTYDHLFPKLEQRILGNDETSVIQ